MICKQCGRLSLNGTNFCSRKCRKLWTREHNYTKKEWQRIHRRNENILIKLSGGVDMEDCGDKRRGGTKDV